MADDWDAVDQDFSVGAKGAAKDSWDADDAPDSWDAPASKNGPKASSKSETTAKGTAKTAKTAGATAGKKDAAGSDKAIERARIELAKARDVADFISDGGGQGEFELLQPTRKEDFDLLQQLIMTKLSTCKTAKDFNPFVESLFMKLANEVDLKTLKAINTALAMIAKDKELAEKANSQKASMAAAAKPVAEASVAKSVTGAGKKNVPKARANIKVGSEFDTYDDDVYEEEDEFDEFAYRPKSSAPKAAPAATAGGYYDDEGI